ncbi:MAG TPA: Gfo/Idh/MocA family oxidoreductase [Chthoniobacterales bacterium]
MPQKQIRVGVVGLGMGRIHLQNYQKTENCVVQAICDQSAPLVQHIGDEFDVPQRFTGFEDFIEKAEIDAVSLAVPNFLHKPMTLKALDKGIHVMCEKPMAMSAGEAEIMRAKVLETGRKFMIHFNQRFRPEHQYFKKLVVGGDLGNVYYASAGWRRMRGMPRFGGWFGQKKMSGGGPLIDLGVHMLDLSRWLIGNPRVVTVSASTFAHIGQAMARQQAKDFDVEDLASALIRFDDGSSLMLEVSWALNFEEREKVYLEMSGTKGGLSSVSFDYRDNSVCIFREERGAMVKTVPLKYPTDIETAQQYFVRSIVEDFQPDGGADDGVEIMRILDAIYESARIGREVEARKVDLSAPLPEGQAIPPLSSQIVPPIGRT